MAEAAATTEITRRAAERLRLPPHSVEAEQSLLGGLMLDQRAWDQIADAVGIEDFYRADHRLIFAAVGALVERNQPPDAVTVSEQLQRQGQLEAAGGLAYLARLVEDTPSAANIRAYAKIVRERAMLRQLIEIGGDIAASAHGTEGLTVAELVDLAEQRVFEIADRGQRRGSGFVSLKQILPQTIDRLDVLSHSTSDITGVSTGFVDMDELTAGLQRGELIIVAGRPSMGKCIVSGSRILNPATGRLESIDTCVRERQGDLVSLNSLGRLQAAKASAFVDDGIKPVYEVCTALGRRIVVTASHPFLTPNGWQPLAALRADVHIGVPRILPFFGKQPLAEPLVKLVAYFLTDGGLTATVPMFTNKDERIQRDFIEAISYFHGMRCRIETSNGTRTPTVHAARDFDAIRSARRVFGARLRDFLRARGLSLTALASELGVAVSTVHYWVTGAAAPVMAILPRLSSVGFDVQPSPDGASIHKNGDNPVAGWLASLGLWGKSAHGKHVPTVIFELPREQLALFLNRAFACDGSIYVQNTDQVGISYSTVSEQFARDMQHLLLRFGIVAKLRCRQILYRGSRRRAYELRVLRQEDIARFVREIGVFGKEEAAARALRVSLSKRAKVNADVIPADVWGLIEAKKGTRTWSEIGKALGLGKGINLHVGERGLSRERLRRIAEVLDDDALRNLATSDVYWDRIESIQYIGDRQVYDLTVPEHHNFIAEDILVHNTSLAMNIAENAAIGQQIPTAIFSMEMSAEQLSFRMIGSIGRVNQSRLRNGRLSDEDWSRIDSAVSMMSNAPIFIDDSAALTPTEVRARSRRLKREHGLGLIVVDYLQLMQVTGTVENRATEISEISRSLKALSKELDVPVIALSQLNRSVEQRTDKKPVMSDLRECVTGETLVCLTDGRRAPIRELVGAEPEVWSLDGRQRVIPARADKVWCVGRRSIFRVQLASGRSIRATAQHRLLAGAGWTTVSDLAPGDRLALARRLPEPQQPLRWPDHALILLGHLVGDGSYLRGQPLRYTTASEENSTAVRAAAEAFGCRVTRYAGAGAWHQLLLSGNGNRWRPAAVGRWLKDLGLFDQRSHEKHLPSDVFALGDDQVALLLRHLWATDGSITLRRAGQRGAPRVYFSTCSQRLAGDVAALLLRLGIVARVRVVHSARGRPLYTVDVSGAGAQRRFVELVGGYGPRAGAAAQLRLHLSTIDSNTNVDTLPAEVFTAIRAQMRARGVTTRAMTQLRGTAYGGSSHFRFAPSRMTVADYARLLAAPDIAEWAESDLFWDRIVAVIPEGEEEVFDLTVPGPANWLADGVVTHNSGAIEQDADLIVFIFREEVYEPDTPRKGVADIIIAKQRNGPIGEFHLTFLGEFTKFENLVAEAYGEGVF
ncbi:MAG TPA: replicative DNA helicase [Gammaproteobacteria bacterium]|nr:replicative DNA helicase [Gammaproteobacteria bacterium]